MSQRIESEEGHLSQRIKSEEGHLSQRVEREEGHLSQRIEREEEHLSQERESTDRNVKEEYTGSSRYASAESDMGLDESFGMQRMSLRPTGAATHKNRLDPANSVIRPAEIPASQNANTVEPSQLQTYFKAAMDKFFRVAKNKELTTRSSQTSKWSH
uniref:Uncharacterized protein n=1 Tax=Peronospora matthiolae TaxID=2874970 RepID=A0AAV1TJE4_9STRA